MRQNIYVADDVDSVLTDACILQLFYLIFIRNLVNWLLLLGVGYSPFSAGGWGGVGSAVLFSCTMSGVRF